MSIARKHRIPAEQLVRVRAAIIMDRHRRHYIWDNNRGREGTREKPADSTDVSFSFNVIDNRRGGEGWVPIDDRDGIWFRTLLRRARQNRLLHMTYVQAVRDDNTTFLNYETNASAQQVAWSD